FDDEAVRNNALPVLGMEYPDLNFSTGDGQGGYLMTAEMRDTVVGEERRNAVTQNSTPRRNRGSGRGVAEPVIQRQGADRIVVQLPGVQDTAKAKDILGATATLEYRLVHGTYSDWVAAAQSGRVPVDARLYYQRGGEPVLLKRSVIVT